MGINKILRNETKFLPNAGQTRINKARGMPKHPIMQPLKRS